MTEEKKPKSLLDHIMANAPEIPTEDGLYMVANHSCFDDSDGYSPTLIAIYEGKLMEVGLDGEVVDYTADPDLIRFEAVAILPFDIDEFRKAWDLSQKREANKKKPE